MTFYAAWLLTVFCALALGLGQPGRGSGWALAGTVVGIIAGLILVLTGRLLDQVSLGGAVVALALLRLARPGAVEVGRLGSAALALQGSALLMSYGLPVWAALLPGLLAALLPVWLHSRNARFAPVSVQEEALLLVLVLGIVLGAAPEVGSGWRSALILNTTVRAAGTAHPIPHWVLLSLAAATALGVASRWWRRGF